MTRKLKPSKVAQKIMCQTQESAEELDDEMNDLMCDGEINEMLAELSE